MKRQSKGLGIETVIFDCAGTLLEQRPSPPEVYCEVARGRYPDADCDVLPSLFALLPLVVP